jgi:hypothetical protein
MKLRSAVLLAPAHSPGDNWPGLPSLGGHATVLTLHATPADLFQSAT